MPTCAVSAQPRATLGEPQSAKSEATVEDLVGQALAVNPTLQRLRFQVQAAYERVPQVRALPDPMISGSVFGHPIETAAGSQRGNLMLSQKVPWIHRLTAQEQQAAVEAQSLEQLLAAESLIVAARVRIAVYQLYVIEQKVRINEANQTLLKSLTKAALGRVKVGQATQGDVLRATLELSRLEADLRELEQQRVIVRAKLNQLLDRPAEASVIVPEQLDVELSARWTLDVLRELAWMNQPEIVSARLKQDAAQLGIRIAHLQQVPDLTFSVSTFFIESNRPPTPIVDVGRDAWSVGIGLNIPLWHDKYNAMRREATAKYQAAAVGVQETFRKYDTALAEALEKARAAERIRDIYDKAILPQARQTFNVDLQAYRTPPGRVEFDRVITDFRNLITAEIGYHESIGQLAIALAQLEQLAGVPLMRFDKDNE